MDIQQELNILISSRSSTIFVSTVETYRAIAHIRNMAYETARACFEGHIDNGIFRTDQKNDRGEHEFVMERPCHSVHDFLNFAQEFDDIERNMRPVFVFPDIQNYLNDPVVKAKIKYCTARFQETKKNLIFVSHISRADIPLDLQDSVAVIDMALPDNEAILKSLKQFRPHATQKKLYKITADHERNFAANASGLTMNQITNYYKRLSATNTPLTDKSVFEIAKEKKETIQRVKALSISDPVPMEELGGQDLLKSWLMKRKNLFSVEAQSFGIIPPKGMLLVGSQGVGKSLAAKTVSSVFDIPLIRFDLAMTHSRFVGDSEAIMNHALKIVDAVSPCVLFIDEIEKTLQTSVVGSEVTLHILSQLLTWMQESNNSFIVATSNNIDNLPSELIRRGRFDEIFYVDLPNQIEREQIFSIHLRKAKRNVQQFDVVLLATQTQNFTGAEIEQVIKDALIEAFYKGGQLTDNEILTQILSTTPRAEAQREQIDALRRRLLDTKLAKPASTQYIPIKGKPSKTTEVIDGLGSFAMVGQA